MDLTDRQARYQAIEKYRKRPLIVYATSTRVGIRAPMSGDVVREFIDQVDAIPPGNAVDILIHSNGGDGLVAWKLMAVLRERFEDVAVLVPSAAFSAATLFALGANQIIMHPHASLGPTDPQITVRLPDGQMKQFAYEDLGAFLKFLREEVALTEQKYFAAVADKLFSSTDPVVVGAAKRAASLAAEVGERLLSMHMSDDRKAHQIAQNLAKTFFAHGDAVSRKRAKTLELQVAPSDKELERLIWEAYLGLESYMDLRTPHQPLAIFLSDPVAAASLTPAPPLNLPPNLPPQVVNQIVTQVANNAIQAAAGGGVEVPYSLVIGLVESTRCASELIGGGKLSAVRQPSGEIRVNLVEPGPSWRPSKAAAAAPAAAAPAAPAAAPKPASAAPKGPGQAAGPVP